MKHTRIAVLGAGTMGRGIAQLFASHGYRTSVYDPNPDQLEEARRAAGIESGPDGLSSFTTDLAATVQSADWVFEAAPEVESVKRQLYRDIAPWLKPDAIVASNTSTFALTKLAALSPFPDRLVIAHFFNPAAIIPLVEVVQTSETLTSAADALMALLRSCGKTPLLLGRDAPGFIANRLQAAVMREACHLLESGVATAEQIDTAVRDGVGLRWALAGPFEIADRGGLDIWEKVTGHLFPELADDREAPAAIRQRVREGRLGTKTGQGFYAYAEHPSARQSAARAVERKLQRLLNVRDSDDPE